MYIIYLGKKLIFVRHRIPAHKRVGEEHPCNKKARASKVLLSGSSGASVLIWFKFSLHLESFWRA
jgi:hypothetical protein